MDEKIISKLIETTSYEKISIENVLEMHFTEKATIPFIARYRKEKTKNLDEEQIKEIIDLYQKEESLDFRKKFVIDKLKENKVLTSELEKSILEAKDLSVVESLYAPFKSKKKTKAMIARENGFEELALKVFHGSVEFHKANSKEEAIEGVEAIIAELVSTNQKVRNRLIEDTKKYGVIQSKKKKGAEKISEAGKFHTYFDYSERVNNLYQEKNSHRFLALIRGESLKVLSLKLVLDEEKMIKAIFYELNLFKNKNYDFLFEVVTSAYKKSLLPSIKNLIFSELKLVGDTTAIDVFSKNLKQLLLAPYLGAKKVLAIDPGVRTGCKVVVLNEQGDLIDDFVVYPHPPKNQEKETIKVLEDKVKKYEIDYLVIGSGTYGKETAELLKAKSDYLKTKKISLISESGASIYSASKVAREEFPEKDVTVRGAVSIGRRFQDPLAELIKIDPKSIGVGQYQHDVNQKMLKDKLDFVVESCVNQVGVNINTASKYLLSYISGIGPTLATNIVNYRSEKKGFKNRDELKNVSRFSEKNFEQSIGFLKIKDGSNPLDATFIHPENYHSIKKWCEKKNIEVKKLLSEEQLKNKFEKDQELKNQIGEFTFKDIVDSIYSKNQDIRSEFKVTEFSKSIESLNDLKIGSWYTGVVTNLTQFGAFIDLGIKENGLLHVSQMAENKFIKNPNEVLSLGEEIKVKVIETDAAKKRISLSLKK